MVRGTQAVFSVIAMFAPAAVRALVWNGPHATLIAPAIDAWSPAPTSAPELKYRVMQMFQKRQTSYDNTCGYQYANSLSSLTCNDATKVCATNSNFGVHGCCDPASLTDCILFTTCYASTAISSCTGDCLSNDYVARCTESTARSCYNWLYDYGTTTMTEFGCAASGFTIAVSRTYLGENSTAIDQSSQLEVPISTRVVTVTAGDSSSSSTSAGPVVCGGSNSCPPRKKSNIGAIVGGVVGGVLGIAAIVAAVVFALLRNKKKKKQAAAAAAPNTQTGYAPPPMQQHAPQSPQQQYPPGTYPQGTYPQGAYAQPAPQGGYYEQQKSQDYKYSPQQPMNTPPPAHGAVELGGGQNPGPGPYSPVPGSPAPVYSGPHSPNPQDVQQLDSTAISTPPAQRPGVHEAP